MQDLFEVHEGGEPRRLGTLVQPESALTRLWTPHPGIEGTNEPVDRSRIQPTNNAINVLRVADQDGVGECAAGATVSGFEFIRNVTGLDPIPFSAGDIYRRTSGGSDNGSLPEDNLLALLEGGVLPESHCGYTDWRHDYDTQNKVRPMYKGLEAWINPTVEHIATSCMMGFPSIIGYWHHQSDPTDANGWMTHPTGRRGGHSVLVVDVVLKNSMIGFKFLNQWRKSWGLDGYGILPLTRLVEGLASFASWTPRAVTFQSINLPPLKKAA